jgi:hypothetical protein
MSSSHLGSFEQMFWDEGITLCIYLHQCAKTKQEEDHRVKSENNTPDHCRTVAYSLCKRPERNRGSDGLSLICRS